MSMDKKVSKSKHSIEIDCAPGYPRPGDLIDSVIEGTGLPKKKSCLRFFGNWVWEYNEISDEKWAEIQPIIKERLTKLYNSGTIRYASW